ncbi:MAG TPA: D-alanyl-D-alanine carboxypeptidase family protein [Solirubrobacterales bacterium]
MPSLRLRALALACFAFALLAPSAAAKPAEPPQPAAEAWILIDARDGERLAADDATDQRSIASATKLMTAYLALRERDLDRRVPAPAYQALAAESLLGLEAGERISYRELIYALILASANDGAVTVAEGVSGSVDRFVGKMNATAERLGLEDTSYANPIGLDEPGNYSTAADLAKLATILLEDDFFRKVADTEAHTVKTDRASRPIVTRDDLLTRVPWVTGVKTGFTGEAGNVLVGAGEREGTRLIAVVLGAPSEAARDDGVLSLLEYGFSLYRPEAAVRGREALADPPVDSGGTVELLARRPVTVSVRRDQEVETAVDAPAELEGPVRRGERLGSVEVTVDGRPAGSSPLIAARAAPAPSLGDGVRNNFPTLAVVGGALIVIVLAVVIVRRTRRVEGRGATR